MERQFPTELMLEAAHKHKGKYKKILYIPTNEEAMSNIQKSFESNMASNPIMLRALNSPPNRPSFPYQSNSDPGAYGQPLPQEGQYSV